MGSRLGRLRGCARAALSAAAVLAAPGARAQEVGDMALEQLEPSQAGDPFLGVPSPFIGGHLVPRFAALAGPLFDDLAGFRAHPILTLGIRLTGTAAPVRADVCATRHNTDPRRGRVHSIP